MNSEIYKFVFKMMEAFDKAEKAMEDDEFKVNLEKFVNACVKKVIWSKNLFHVYFKILKSILNLVLAVLPFIGNLENSFTEYQMEIQKLDVEVAEEEKETIEKLFAPTTK